MTMRLRRFCFAVVSTVLAAQCAAQDTNVDVANQAAGVPNEFEVSLHVWPAAEPKPALKYRLRVEDHRLRDGDVMHGVTRATLASKRIQDGDKLRQQYADRRDTWLADDSDESIRNEIRTYLGHYKKVLNDLHLAAQYRSVSQDSRFLELSGAEVYFIELDEIQELRDLGRLIELECKPAIRIPV